MLIKLKEWVQSMPFIGFYLGYQFKTLSIVEFMVPEYNECKI